MPNGSKVLLGGRRSSKERDVDAKPVATSSILRAKVCTADAHCESWEHFFRTVHIITQRHKHEGVRPSTRVYNTCLLRMGKV